MQPYWATHFLLPDQEHPNAQAIGEALEHAREGLAMLAGCDPFEIVFTDGGTAANNLAILGQLRTQEPGHVLLSVLEHGSVQAAASHLRTVGWDVETFPCDDEGLVDPDQVASRMRSDTRLVCLQAANPVLGTIQPVREVADLCHSHGVPLHCDATQMFGKLPVDAGQLRADTVAVSGHKFYGPKGTGAIYIRRGLQLTPVQYGEPREMGLQVGAGNVPGFVGLGSAAALASRCSGDVADNLTELRQRLVDGLKKVVQPAPIVLCEDSPRLPNTVAIEMPGEAKRLQRAARQLVVATARSNDPPDATTSALRAIGRSDSQIGRTICVSLGWTTTRDQIDRAVEMLAEAWDRLALP